MSSKRASCAARSASSVISLIWHLLELGLDSLTLLTGQVRQEQLRIFAVRLCKLDHPFPLLHHRDGVLVLNLFLLNDLQATEGKGVRDRAHLVLVARVPGDFHH